MSDDLVIDASGKLLTPPEQLRLRLAPHAGAWKLLSVGPGLFVGLRRSGVDLALALPQLEAAMPALAGDLREFPPSDLISLLHQGRRSGILLTSSGNVERCLVLVDGTVTWVSSSSPTEWPRAAMSAEADERARELDEKALDIVCGLLTAGEGSFIFLRVPANVRLPQVFALDAQSALLEGLRRLDEMQLYRERVKADSRPQRVGSALPQAGGEITPQALQLLQLADGQRTVAELALAAGLGEFAATRAVYHFLISGHLRDAVESATG